ncbi:NAD-dependent epimerase/dehydratase family protein [Kitasatospora albolonga]|uniref:NAD-dependent epimerase/dehydratase family protein n=1 Tax=Kitasatospora albolonga TaxID=68173 RepID=UPI0031EC55FF
MGKTVLVTGVARHLGARFAARLAARPGIDRVVGLDSGEPWGGMAADGVEYVRAELRRPAVARVLAEHAVDTVVHLDVSAGTGSRAAAKENNVIGTMQLLGACQKAPGLRRLVVKSTTAVYGSAPRDPAVFGERTLPRALPRDGFGKDATEVEGYVRGFARRRADVAVTVLRFANIVGPAGDTPLSDYFALPVLPTVLGRDPRLQFVHEDDAVDILHRAATEQARPGTYNVAGEGVLLLSQCARRLGRPTVPLLGPALGLAAGAARWTGLADISPEQIQLLSHGRVVSTGQLRETFGWEPGRSTPDAFADFAAAQTVGLLPPGRLAAATDRLAELLTRQTPTRS